MRRTLAQRLALALGLAAIAAAPALAGEKKAETKKIVLIAGNPSHGPGDHEFNAGMMLVQKCLQASVPNADPVLVKGGWPKDEGVFDDAAAVVFFMDGGGGHPMIQGHRLQTMQQLMDKGVGLACLHYAVEVPKGEPGKFFLDNLGGYYETGFSTNPHWTAEFKTLPEVPVTRGVKPFSIRDEWYFNIRFPDDKKGFTPILVAKPDDATRQGVSASPRGPYKHIVEAKGRDEILAWTFERSGGGRSFGFTGAHTHKNWGNPNFRKLVLNAILWTAKMDIPENGVECEVSDADLAKNLDPKGK